MPQYTIALEGDDATLAQRAKELPADVIEGSHWNDAGMNRRLKDYRARNVEDSGKTVKDFFMQHIGHHNVISIDVTTPEND